MKQLQAEVLASAFEHLRRCGAGRRECVVYLTSDQECPGMIDGVVHPSHRASAGGYDLDSGAIAKLWQQLLSQGRSIQAQVHTHPGRAYHSSRDDSLALVSSNGALSLVIPDFAQGPVGLSNAFLARADGDGRWTEIAIAKNLEVVE